MASLQRLLASLSYAYYPPAASVSLTVFADWAPDVKPAMQAILQDYTWTHGPYQIKFAAAHKVSFNLNVCTGMTEIAWSTG